MTLSLVGTACGDDGQRIDAAFGADDTPASAVPPTADPAAPATSATSSTTSTSSTSPTTTSPTTTTTSSTTTTTTTTSTTTTSTTTTSTTTTTVPGLPPVPELPAAVPPTRPLADPALTATNAAFERLSSNNLGASLTVSHGGQLVLSRASGPTVAGGTATADTPTVVASVSKLVVAVAIARLDQLGLLDDTELVPWDEVGLAPHDAWRDVTVRELMEHSAGMPVARTSWFRGGTDCRTHVQSLLTQRPQAHRGEWTYSNGNYCVLGLVVEARTSLPLAFALQHLVFDPVGVSGVHLTDNGLLPDDMPHPHGAGVARLSRLGAAGNLLVSTDDLAAAIGRLTPLDREVLTLSTVFRDQYGFGHTGTIDGAKACVWALDGGATVVAAAVAGDSPSTGGGVCDIVVPAVSVDAGLGGGAAPDRDP